ncbi:MAG TPA: iron ABC transporter permease [Acidimicrobiales bacterium]|nr:iron ABC transporter permease [Acidimicrobiales bacterium]
MAGRRAGPKPPLGLLAAAAAVAVAALLPVVYLVVRAGEGGWDQVADVLLAESTARLLARSLGLAAAVTAASALIGTGLAWLTVRCDLPGRRAWKVTAALPLAIPSYVGGFAYLATFPSLTGFVGAWLTLTLLSYPYVFLPVAAALEGLDPSLEETARSLGDTRARAFRRVTFRQLRPAMATGSLLVALYVLSDFGAVSILRFDSFTRVIYQSYRASFDRTPAAILGCLLLVFTLVIVVAEGRTRGAARYHSSGAGVRRPPPLVRLGRARWPLVLVPAAVAALALAVPAATLVRWVADGAESQLGVERLWRATGGSLVAASSGAVATAVAAVPVALLAARYRTRLAATFERSAYVGHALPGIVIALSLVFFSVRYVSSLYQRLPVLVFAYVVLFLPLAVSAAYASAVQAPPVLDEVARSLGRRPLAAFRTVTLPLIAPGVAAGAALVFLTAMKELPATLLLAPTGFDTLATRVWASAQVGSYGEAALPAAMLVVVAAVPTWALSRRIGLEANR